MHFIREGKGPAVFLLHGFASSSEIWRPTIAHLARHFDVIAPDWPGFGQSAGMAPCATLPAFARCVNDLADALDLDRFSVIGHSMSGFVVQQLLCESRQRIAKAVLYGAGTRIDAKRRFESAARTMERLAEDGADATSARVISTWFADGSPALLRETCLRAAAGMTVQAGCAAIGAMQDADFSRRLHDIATRTLVILGEHEHSHPPSMGLELHAALANASLCILPGCGHAAHLERPELFNSVVTDFLLAG